VEAAEQVCEEPLALDYLAQLRECSLVLSDETALGMRFRMLEMLREFGEARLNAEERVYLLQCHTNYFHQLAEQAEQYLSGAESALWLDRLETEHDNLRAALRWSWNHGNAEAHVGLACALGQFWIIRGHLNEGRAWLQSALRLDSDTSGRARVRALNAASRLVWHQGDYGLAQSFLEECLTIQKELGDGEGLARVYNNMGNLAFLQSDYGRARLLLEESLALFRDLGDREGTAGALNEVGNVLYRQGDFESARPLFQESLEVFQRLGHEEGMARALNSLGLMAWHQGDAAAARSFQERSLTLFQKLEDKWGIAFTLTNLGNVSAMQGDYEKARALHGESLRRFREMGDRRGSAYALNNQAIMMYRQGNYAAAWENHAESLKIRRELADRRGIAFSLEGIAILAAARQRVERAARLFGAAQALRKAIGLPLAPVDRADYEHGLALARAGLSAEAFVSAWTEGSALEIEEAVAYALEESLAA
jgi:tetratricopeptide (TPR) repeat protein